jgi:hypothetical protein
VPSVEVGIPATVATQIELSSQRLVQLSHSCFGQSILRSFSNQDTHEIVQQLQSIDRNATTK